MSSSGPTFLSETSPTTNHDSMESFKHFLDIVNPPEFAKLLRARVKHLLKIWPPQSESAVSATSSPSLTSSNANSPSFESIRGFAAFFRTQGSTGSSTIDLSATTSLQALHNHLQALQTLLSFLSARELQEIVRARLTEIGKDRSAAVQGLMDVIQDSRGEDGLDQLVGKEDVSLIDGNRRSNKDGEAVEAVDQPLMPTGEVPPSDTNVGKRKAISNSCVDMDTEAEKSVCPPKKRQRHENETGDGLEKSQADSQISSHPSSDVSNQSTLTPVSAFPPSDASSSPSTLVVPSIISENSDSTIVHSDLKLKEEPRLNTDKDAQPISNSEVVSESLINSDSRREKSVVENHDDMKAEASITESRASTNVLHSSDVEDEGIVVTLIEVDTAKRGPQAISSSPTEPLPTVQEEQALSDSPSVPVAVSSAPTNITRPEEENPTPPVLLDADLKVGPGPGISLVEWNKKRIRAALGLPPKGPENVLGDGLDAAVTVNTASTAQEETHPNADCTSPNLVSRTNETATNSSDVAANSTTTSQDASVASARPQTPATTRHAGFPISRSPSPSVRGSSCGSPPGPMLRAVDWGSRPFPEQTDSDVEMNELDELDGSEDTLAVGNGTPYNLDANTDGLLKFSPYNEAFAYQHLWQNVHGFDGRMWDHTGPNPYGMSHGISQVGHRNQGAGATDSQQKLFIRLPARGSKGDNGAVTGTDGSGSGSGSGSPNSQSLYPLAPSSGQPGVAYERIGKDTEHLQRIKLLSSLVSADTSLLPPSHGQSQATSASHTPNLMSGAVPHGAHIPPGHQPPSYPPPPPYGQWLTPMFYVPFGSTFPPPPHAQAQSAGYTQMYSPSQVQMSPTPGSRSGGESGPSPLRGESPGSGSMGVMVPSGGPDSPNDVLPPQGPRRKRRGLGEGRNSDGEELQILYTDDIGKKESATVKRFCNNCHGMQAPSWRKSKLHSGKILCNKCGIYESTHMTPRPLRTRPRRCNMEALAAKRRKTAMNKKLAPAPAVSAALPMPPSLPSSPTPPSPHLPRSSPTPAP